ncbi:MAG: hypothetical protein ACI4F2_09715 [Acutalibacteraceae bacterium]
MNVKDIDPCDKSFPQKLIEAYGDYVTPGVKTTEELIEECDNKYGLTQIEFTELDDIALSRFRCFEEMLCNLGCMCDRPDYKYYLLEDNPSTRAFYDDYYSSFKDYYRLTGKTCKIAVFFETVSGKYGSCSSMLEFMLNILKGVSQADVDSKSWEYFHYLNNYYLLDCIAEGI